MVLPTGSGKSLVYSLPAVALGGLSIVVSPLVALMEDQAAALTRQGVPAAQLSSGTGAAARTREAERLAAQGRLRVLFVSPEGAWGSRRGSTGEGGALDDTDADRDSAAGSYSALGYALASVLRASRSAPVLVAVDEAHCVSGWGHDFRPAYRGLGGLRDAIERATWDKRPGAQAGDGNAEAALAPRRLPLLALTATAAPAVRDDVILSLRLQRPRLLLASFDRPDLFLSVLHADAAREEEGGDDGRDGWLHEALKKLVAAKRETRVDVVDLTDEGDDAARSERGGGGAGTDRGVLPVDGGRKRVGAPGADGPQRGKRASDLLAALAARAERHALLFERLNASRIGAALDGPAAGRGPAGPRSSAAASGRSAPSLLRALTEEAIAADRADRGGSTAASNAAAAAKRAVQEVLSGHARSVIVYCRSRECAEEAAGELGRLSSKIEALLFGAGARSDGQRKSEAGAASTRSPAAASSQPPPAPLLRSACYHAGLGSRDRTAIVDAWAARRLDVIAATSAFGMGIDRPDVDCVIHAQLPRDLESLYQEAGRAGRGRDRPAMHVLVHSAADARAAAHAARMDDKRRGDADKKRKRERGEGAGPGTGGRGREAFVVVSRDATRSGKAPLEFQPSGALRKAPPELQPSTASRSAAKSRAAGIDASARAVLSASPNGTQPRRPRGDVSPPPSQPSSAPASQKTLLDMFGGGRGAPNTAAKGPDLPALSLEPYEPRRLETSPPAASTPVLEHEPRTATAAARAVAEYAMATSCRRRLLLAAFGEDFAPPVSAAAKKRCCDACADPAGAALGAASAGWGARGPVGGGGGMLATVRAMRNGTWAGNGAGCAAGALEFEHDESRPSEGLDFDDDGGGRKRRWNGGVGAGGGLGGDGYGGRGEANANPFEGGADGSPDDVRTASRAAWIARNAARSGADVFEALERAEARAKRDRGEDGGGARAEAAEAARAAAGRQRALEAGERAILKAMQGNAVVARAIERAAGAGAEERGEPPANPQAPPSASSSLLLASAAAAVAAAAAEGATDATVRSKLSNALLAVRRAESTDLGDVPGLEAFLLAARARAARRERKRAGAAASTSARLGPDRSTLAALVEAVASPDDALPLLRTLKGCGPPSAKQLAATGAGKAMRKLRGAPVAEVSSLATELLEAWRRAVVG